MIERTSEKQDSCLFPVCVVTPEGTIQFSSQAVLNTLGRNSGPLIGRNCREAFNCTAADTCRCPLSEIKANPKRLSASMRRSNDILTEIAEPMLDASGNISAVLLSFHSDLQSQAMSHDLIKLQKLETIAEAAGGIVHDLNNIFMCVDAEVNMLKEQLEEQSTNHGTSMSLSSILRVISRGEGLTRHLLKLSKGQQPKTMPMHIGETIREAVTFSLLSSLVQPVFRISDNLNLVTTNSEQIFQLISNLVMNARHATNPNSGSRITITAENVDETEAGQAGLATRKYVRITVQDQGHGIPEEHMGHIFEPFYTTKPQGTGLGLSLVNLIVKELSGHITVESTVGKGSKFTVFLPAVSLDDTV